MKQDLYALVEQQELIPIYATEEAAGADLKANIVENVTILPGESALIPTGIKLEIPRGYEVQLRPRSGLALKHGITILNTPATIDSDYRGEIKVILINHSKHAFVVTPKMRIAQMVLAHVLQANFIIKDELASSLRGEGGFGHSGSH
ncbi:MAG: dUTP diphosphatase [Chlamydiales bacterium]|nr:dUTP diphosphatase [Chlamydiales bacterium]